MSYRDELDALNARHAALSAEVADKSRDLAATRELIEATRARMKLPVLDGIKVAAPCKEDWATMTGDERTRHCGRCDKSVYNLSDMTRAEAEALLIAKEGRLCVRYFQRADGTILTADCPDGLARRRRRNGIIAAAVGAAAAMVAGGAVASHHSTMGEVPVPPLAYTPAPVEPSAPILGQMVAPEPSVEIKGEVAPMEATMGAVALPELAPRTPAQK